MPDRALEDLVAALPPAPPTPPDGLPLGNRRAPFAELIYILLTLMTRSQPSIDRAYTALEQLTDGDLGELDRVPMEALADALRPVGLVNRRSGQLRAIAAACRPIDAFEDELRGSTTQQVLERLQTLPGVGSKTAKCVALYSLERPVLPVDIHVLRVAKRIGVVPERTSWAAADELLERTVPDELKWDVHVRFVTHGRSTCLAARPRCDECVIASSCPSRGTAGEDRRDLVG